LGLLSTGLAHELQNPLNFVLNFSTIASEIIHDVIKIFENKENIDEDKEITKSLIYLDTLLEKINSHGKRADSIIKKLVRSVHQISLNKQASSIPILINSALDIALNEFYKKAPGFKVNVKKQYDSDLMPLEVFPKDLIQVFISIIDNSCFALNEKCIRDPQFVPQIEIDVENQMNSIKIGFKDNGGGISNENIDKIFQPFFTTKSPGEGSGLALSLAYEVITQLHLGKMAVFSDHSTYAKFLITLPKKPLK